MKCPLHWRPTWWRSSFFYYDNNSRDVRPNTQNAFSFIGPQHGQKSFLHQTKVRRNAACFLEMKRDICCCFFLVFFLCRHSAFGCWTELPRELQQEHGTLDTCFFNHQTFSVLIFKDAKKVSCAEARNLGSMKCLKTEGLQWTLDIVTALINRESQRFTTAGRESKIESGIDF